jgi:hypothetical protein
MTTATRGATIRYTTDGTVPSQTNGTVYSGAFVLTSSTTVRAIAYKNGMADSAVASAALAVRAAPPAISPPAGTYSNTVNVMLTPPTSGAAIRYTTNGTAPSATAGNLYTGPFALTGTAVVKAIACKTGMTDSAVNSATFMLKVATPVITPNGGTYAGSVPVSLNTTTTGVTIRYTMNGSTPTASFGTVYTGTFTLSSNATVKAIAYRSGMTNSSVASASFTISP